MIEPTINPPPPKVLANQLPPSQHSARLGAAIFSPYVTCFSPRNSCPKSYLPFLGSFFVMFPQHAFAGSSFSKTQSPDPSAPRTLPSRLDLGTSTGYMHGAQSLWEVGRSEGQYSLQNVPDAQQRAMEEESNEQTATGTPAFSPALFSDIGLDDHLEQKHPSGKQFPFKVYE